MKLIDVRTNDGSRHFVRLPRSATWHALRDQILLLPGAEIANFVVDGVAEPWIDFTYQGHRFSVKQEGEEFCFCVCDPQCPDVHLYQVASHCEKLLGGESPG